MVQTSISFFVTLTAMISLAGNALALPVQVSPQNLDTRDDSDHILEARMFRKLAQEIGKEIYTQGANAVLHGPPAILQGQSSRPNTRMPRPPAPETKKTSPQNRPGLSLGKMEPLKFPNMAPKPSIGSITQAVKDKVNWSKPPSVADAVKNAKKNTANGGGGSVAFDQKKVGKAKEAPAGKSAPKLNTGKKAKEAPW